MDTAERKKLKITLRGESGTFKSPIAFFIRKHVEKKQWPIDLEIIEITPRKTKVKK